MTSTNASDSERLTGDDGPLVRVHPPGPRSLEWLARAAQVHAPMGPKPGGHPAGMIVHAAARGANVLDVDGNRFVDLAAGFGAMLVGHSHPRVVDAVKRQSERLLQALGDVHPSDVKLELAEALAALCPTPGARVILGQSGADAVSAALKTAVLATGRSGVIAFEGAYHGLSYGPLAACGLRAGYREPFRAQLNPAVQFVGYPGDALAAARALTDVERMLAGGEIGAVLVEPILGRGGCVVPPPGFLAALGELSHAHGTLLIADEIWTGLGRAGEMLCSGGQDPVPDLICLGKGLGGGLPISACVGSEAVMAAWSREPEVVHTATFAGAPLACAAALATLAVLRDEGLIERSARLGETFQSALRDQLRGVPGVAVRGAGLMVAVETAGGGRSAVQLARALLEGGYLVSTGGGAREVLVLTPPLTVAESQLQDFGAVLRSCLEN